MKKKTCNWKSETNLPKLRSEGERAQSELGLRQTNEKAGQVLQAGQEKDFGWQL